MILVSKKTGKDLRIIRTPSLCLWAWGTAPEKMTNLQPNQHRVVTALESAPDQTLKVSQLVAALFGDVSYGGDRRRYRVAYSTVSCAVDRPLKRQLIEYAWFYQNGSNVFPRGRVRVRVQLIQQDIQQDVQQDA